MNSSSVQAQSLPAAAIDRVRGIAGNEACIDCGCSEPDWGDVLHGSLHCIQCAGQHRSLGVSTSFCRSLTMDNWTEANLLAMLLGGNKQLKLFFRRQRIENSSIEVLYKTKQAAYYRDQLALQVEQTLAKRRAETSKPPPPLKRSSSSSRTLRAEDFDVEVTTASLGASLTRALPPPGVAPLAPHGNGSMALVTRVKSDGLAARAGVKIGDYVVAMNGRSVADYDEFVSLFPRCPRPLRLTVRRFRGDEPEKAPEPTDEAEFDEGPLGFSIERDGLAREARVSKVAPGGQAAAAGVAVGDVVVALGSRETPTYDVVVATLPLLPRPLVIKFKKRDGPPAARSAPSRAAFPLRNTKKNPPLAATPPVAAAAGGFGASFRESITVPDVPRDPTSTKHSLGEFQDDCEFDATFDDGPLGMRIEERSGLVPITVVTHVDDTGQAYEAGVRVGCVVIGLNGERYLSHAHTTATLRHAKRPVHVRLRHSD
ncbi:hypothetical protein CTAYLR_008566 [Chrysophaeum taylorii]|uniref:Uncharacterized protein n=1 Tax=Chrysophaeum taylorii TaxID=2483200 RepID=A0AAD7U6F4_9STRA|nr:hypothetical protein CTAYLR_008566 [Chrysophaeum taylorii]